MHKTTNLIRSKLAVAAALLVFCLVPQPGIAQAPDGIEVGIIPGTKLSRNEFRSLALVQLNVTALSAAAYKLVHGNYPTTLSELMQSEVWNLDLMNVFSGMPVEEIQFDPTPADMFNQPAVGLGFPVDLPTVVPSPAPPPQPDGGENVSGGGDGTPFFDPNAMIQGLQGGGNIGPWRANPGMIQGVTAGDIFFYSKDDLLQLVMFAPDGTYLENVVEGANPNWQRNLMVGGPFPDCVLAAEILFFIGEQLPQYYNLVQFMGDRETIPMGQYPGIGAAERIELAAELGVVVLNPFTKEAITVSAQASRGDFYIDETQPATPLRLVLGGEQAMTLDELRAAKPVVADEAEGSRKPASDRKGAPPMGGRKTKQSH